METLKCKVCGGNLVLNLENDLGTCEYCGTIQTITSSPDDERKIRLFNMGNRYRTAGEFDRAISLFEKVTEMDDTDAEAHWCLALSRHGIEYVNSAGKYVPTCHRVGVQTILQDLDYQAALSNASSSTKIHYEQAAAEIAEIEKRIYAISQREKPFDVFICYKETDNETGQRTQDSVDAQEIYYQLTDKGYKVFFSRITLESRGGEEYEPYIYAALHSAKVMIVIGSEKEYFESPWVKNEWSRYLNIIREEKQHNGYSSRLLIPCYRNIDAYDIPDELNIFQSHNMSKIGFAQDLLHGIEKVVGETKKEEGTLPAGTGQNQNSQQYTVVPTTSTPLLERAMLFLESSDWDKAIAYCERVLDTDPRNAQAYFIRMLAGYKAKDVVELQEKAVVATEDSVEYAMEVETNGDFKQAKRFADSAMQVQLDDLVEGITLRFKRKTYENALKLTQAANSMDFDHAQQALLKAMEALKSCQDYYDASQQLEKCKNVYADSVYLQAKEYYEKAPSSNVDAKLFYSTALNKFKIILGFRDSDILMQDCESTLKYMEAKEAQENAKSKLSLDYCERAIALYKELGDYRDSAQQRLICEDLHDQLAIKEQTYISCVRNISQLQNCTYGEANTRLIIKTIDDLNRLGNYKDAWEKQKSFEMFAAEYFVGRTIQLVNNANSVKSNKKQHNSDSVKSFDSEREQIKAAKSSNPRISIEYDRLMHHRLNLMSSTGAKTASASTSTAHSSSSDLGTAEKWLLGIAVVVVGLLVLSVL